MALLIVLQGGAVAIFGASPKRVDAVPADVDVPARRRWTSGWDQLIIVVLGARRARRA